MNGSIKPVMKPKYKGSLIDIDLTKFGYNDYSVECNYYFDDSAGKYALSLYLRRNDIADRMKISSKGIDTQYIHGDKATIVENVCRVVHSLVTVADDNGEKFLDYYVKRYEYELECFDRGNEILEKERLSA